MGGENSFCYLLGKVAAGRESTVWRRIRVPPAPPNPKVPLPSSLLRGKGRGGSKRRLGSSAELVVGRFVS